MKKRGHNGEKKIGHKNKKTTKESKVTLPTIFSKRTLLPPTVSPPNLITTNITP